MVRPGRMYYDGSFEEWEDYLDRVADRARQQRALWHVAVPETPHENEGDLEQL